MSIHIMSEVFQNEDLPPYDRLVMLALADHADDEGRCYPSVARICRRTGMGERGVQKVTKRLVEAGYISIEIGAGRNGVNVYTLTINPRTRCTPAPHAPRTRCATPPHPVTLTPAPGAPKPSLTTIEPSEEPPLAPKPKKARLPENWTPTDEDLEYALSLKLDEPEIKEIADDFHAYWSDRTDAGGSKSARGWRQTWRNRCRDVAPKFIRNRQVARGAVPGGYGRRSSLAGIVAQSRANG